MRTPPSHVKRSSWRSRPADTVTHVAPSAEQLARASGDSAECALPGLGQPPIVQILRVRVARLDVFEWNVEPALLPVAIQILPEIRELQRCAESVRRSIERQIVVAGNPQHEAADRVGRSAAIVEQRVPGRVSMRRDILTKRAEQIVEERRSEETGRGLSHQAPGKSGRSDRPQRTRAADSANHPTVAAAPRPSGGPRRRNRRPCGQTRTARRCGAASARGRATRRPESFRSARASAARIRHTRRASSPDRSVQCRTSARWLLYR